MNIERIFLTDELINYDAVDLGELVRKKKVSPVELLEATIGRIERLNPKLNAVIHKMYDQAREAAQRCQLIVSPLLFLGDIGLNANEYLHRIEDLIIELLARYGLHTAKKEGYPGVWYGVEKIAAVGIAIKHGFTFHGFSLNLDPDIETFTLINPCGVKQMPVTSMRQVLGWTPSLPEVKGRLKEILEQHFALETRVASWSVLQRELNRSIETRHRSSILPVSGFKTDDIPIH